ncbi:MAG: hypothetical protein NXI31_01545 [bacterium]|nr:hypothetical protein [bacterium]
MILLAVIPNFAAHGACFVVKLALFAFDVAISIWHLSVEPRPAERQETVYSRALAARHVRVRLPRAPARPAA